MRASRVLKTGNCASHGPFTVFVRQRQAEWRQACAKEDLPANATNLSKMASVVWKTMGDAAKRPYVEEAARLGANAKRAADAAAAAEEGGCSAQGLVVGEGYVPEG